MQLASSSVPRTRARLETEGDLPPGRKRWLISCDESGIDGSPFYGFGTLWMPFQRRGDFAKRIFDLRSRHGYEHEAKWNDCAKRPAFYKELIDLFFRTKWLLFHCLVVRRAMVKKELHDGSFDLARRKHFTMLIVNKVERCRTAYPKRDQDWRVWVDPIASSYRKADEAVEAISNNIVGTEKSAIKVFTHDSKDKPQIQLCDVLLGAVVSSRRNEVTNPRKLEVAAHLARHLGWHDLHADTYPAEKKFNIWYFHDPTLGPRETKSRRVKLL